MRNSAEKDANTNIVLGVIITVLVIALTILEGIHWAYTIVLLVGLALIVLGVLTVVGIKNDPGNPPIPK